MPYRPIINAQRCHDLGICALVWLPEQRWLASSSADTTVKIWQLADGHNQTMRVAHTLHGHTDTVHALISIQALGWLASGSADNSIRIWRIDTSKSSGENDSL